MTYLEKAQAATEGKLNAGETVVAAARMQAKGAAAGMAIGGLAGAAIQSARNKGDRDAAKEVGVKLPNRGVILVTNQRVLIFSQTAFAAKPKKLISEVPTGAIAGAESTGKGFGAFKRIRLAYATGGASEFDVIGRDGVDEIVAALNGLARR